MEEHYGWNRLSVIVVKAVGAIPGPRTGVRRGETVKPVLSRSLFGSSASIAWFQIMVWSSRGSSVKRGTSVVDIVMMSKCCGRGNVE